ncbi:hypothetical protein TNCV_3923501 [Trichonephila clavipes]|nr:hypothetical protein TNCV_3923501 [Trichonephila clavipes]
MSSSQYHKDPPFTLNLSRLTLVWCGSYASSGVVHHLTKITWSVAKSPRVAEQCDVNINSFSRVGKSRDRQPSSCGVPIRSPNMIQGATQ